MKWILAVAAALAVAVLVVMRLGTARAQSGPSGAATGVAWQVEIDMFSGVPNPVFTLTPAEATQIVGQIGQAPALSTTAVSGDSILPSILGYRGMIVRGHDQNNQLVEHTEISSGKIFRKAGNRALLDGKGAGLERTLLSLATSKNAITADQGKYLTQTIP
jgi:hypothetical protein